MITRTVAKKDVELKPYYIWNAFVDLLAMEDYGNLDSLQRPAQLVFQYESEVQNGGHLQYFENCGPDHLTETVEALGRLGAVCQQQILGEAARLFLSREHPSSKTAAEFSSLALEGVFSSFDARFHECSPSLQERLEAYLEQHQTSFVRLI